MSTPRSPVVALMSMTLIALELVWTRILSAEFFYGATMVLVVAFSFGFNVALLGAPSVYLLAFWLLTLRDRWYVFR